MDAESNSASRVKAFRSRMTGQFRRVEAYVTDAEKLEIDKVKQQLGVTTDIAVAGPRWIPPSPFLRVPIPGWLPPSASWG